jgi:hypothetical protein
MPLHPNTLDMGSHFTPDLRRTPTFAVGIAGMALALFHYIFFGFGPRCKIAICPEILATQLLIFLG